MAYCKVFFKILFVESKNLVFLPSQFKIARSSNGRTSVFGTDYVGSNPARATKVIPTSFRSGFFVLERPVKYTCKRGEKTKKSERRGVAFVAPQYQRVKNERANPARATSN